MRERRRLGPSWSLNERSSNFKNAEVDSSDEKTEFNAPLIRRVGLNLKLRMRRDRRIEFRRDFWSPRAAAVPFREPFGTEPFAIRVTEACGDRRIRFRTGRRALCDEPSGGEEAPADEV